MKNVMVVDDEKSIVDTLTQILEKEGHAVTCAHNGSECLAEAKEDTTVLLDIRMPDMDGYEVAKRLKAAFNDKIKIIFVSIRRKAEVDMQYADGFIQKPFNVQDVREEVGK